MSDIQPDEVEVEPGGDAVDDATREHLANQAAEAAKLDETDNGPRDADGDQPDGDEQAQEPDVQPEGAADGAEGDGA